MRRAILALLLVGCAGKFTFTDESAFVADDTDVAAAHDTDGGGGTDTDVAVDTEVLDTDVPGDTDVAPGATTDRCANDDDLAALADESDSLDDTVQQCTLQCVGQRPIGACVTRCLVSETDLSGACSSCFGELVGCVTNQCLRECVDPSSADCTSCREAHCDPKFETCSGVPIP